LLSRTLGTPAFDDQRGYLDKNRHVGIDRLARPAQSAQLRFIRSLGTV
jgi:hypothetical protein